MKNEIGEMQNFIYKMEVECEGRDFLFINFIFLNFSKTKIFEFYNFNIIFKF
jgi:hypothetical protein